jgi:uncharacterized RDD family membrane protein YckC
MTYAPPPPDWSGQQQVAIAGHGSAAGFWIRFVAYMIDGAILSVAAGVAIGVLLSCMAIFGADMADDTVLGIAVIVGVLLMLPLGWLYEALLTSSPRGATFGKRAIGARIVRADGTRLSFGRATARYFLKVIVTPLVPFAIGYLLAAFTSGKRALHDLMAETLVIKAGGQPNHSPAMVATPPAPVAAPIAPIVPASVGSGAPPAPVWDTTRQPGSAATEYGGFWLRVVAYIIDTILLSIPIVIISLVMALQTPKVNLIGVNLLGNSLSLTIGWLYFALMESSQRGATVGKMAVGLRVVNDRGERLSLGLALGRYVAKFISALTLGVGFVMVAFTDRKRGLHDMIAGTLVVKSR